MESFIILFLIVVAGGLGFYARSLRQQIEQTQVDQAQTSATKDTELGKLRSERRNNLDRIVAQDQELERQRARVEDYMAEFERAEKQLEMLPTLADTAYDLLIVVNAGCEILAANEGAREIFGEDIINKDLTDATQVPEMSMMVGDALANQEVQFEEQMTIKDANYRVRALLNQSDKHTFIGLALNDITRLVRLNRARRDMVANISHELRTPIANIRLIIDSLFHDVDKPKRKASIASLRDIARETDSLLWLVQEMSDLSMIESGQAIVRLVEVPLLELVDEAIERMIEQGIQKDINLVRHVPERLQVLCDRDLAKRVVINLIHNALKWSPKNETITVNAASEGDYVTISVLDNGPGVPEDEVDRIFERFYQMDESRSGGEGTGLGLAICRHIVEAHGGMIWAEDNSDGAGGRFLFTLLSAGDLPIEAEPEADVETTSEGESQ